MPRQEPQTSVIGMFYEAAEALAVVAFYGPPVFFFLAPWLLLAVLLSAPFALALLALAGPLAFTALVVLVAQRVWA